MKITIFGLGKKNRNGNTTKIFRIDNKGRKCCILIPEDAKTSGWISFLSMITFEAEVDPRRHFSSEQVGKEVRYYSSFYFETLRRSYASVLLDDSLSESSLAPGSMKKLEA